jgi:hypothetical protein
MLRGEADALRQLAVECEAKDLLTAADTLALTARLDGAKRQIAKIESEVADPTSLAFVSQPNRVNLAPISGGVDSL